MKLKQIFVFALIIRLIIAPIFYHPDIKSQHFHFQFLSKGVFNVYQYIADNKNHFPYRDTFNYPPLTYLSFGVEQIILKPFLPSDFNTWINDWGGQQNGYPNLFYFMLILKIPYIFFDLCIGYLLYKIYNQKTMLYWLFNPFSLYLIYILGNFDIVPVFFSVLAFFLLKKNQSNLAFVSLGIAFALKVYPLLIFPFLLFYKKSNIKIVIKNILFFLLPAIISVVPYIFNTAFLSSISGSGLTQKILEFKMLNIPVYPVIYLVTLAYYFFSKNKKFEKTFLFLFLAFIVFVDFHPQWLLWFLPFFISVVINSKRNISIFIIIILISLAYVFLIDDRYLVWGHLMPVNQSFIQLNNPYSIIFHKFNLIPEIIQKYIKYILAIVSVLFVLPTHDKKS
jgi:hypothetical protein